MASDHPLSGYGGCNPLPLQPKLKTLEQERQLIDSELLEVFSDAELRFGVHAPGGWVLRKRSRTSWDYAPEIRNAIKSLQPQAQRDGRAHPLVSTFLCLSQDLD